MMIQLSKINISFSQPLIQNGSFKTLPGQLTAIIGPSGCGKTSLLNILGLLNVNKDIEYVFFNKKISYKDQELADFRKKHIGYVFQNNMLIEHLNIYENIKFYADTASQTINHDSARNLLKMVHLENDLNQALNTLSGGERQRLAIACALIKDPTLLILDEPTSALDATNAHTIMNILQSIKQTGTTVIIATHDSRITEYCDNIYEIKNASLLLTKQSNISISKTVSFKKRKFSLSFLTSYCRTYLQKHIFSSVLLFLTCALATSSLISFTTLKQPIEKKQIENLDKIANREILITSTKSDDNNYYNSSNPAFSSSTIQRLTSSENLESLCPFFEYYAYQIAVDGEVLESLSCAIQPYPSSRNYQYHCSWTSPYSDGVYVSSSLAKKLEIKQESQITIEFLYNDGSQHHMNSLPVAGVLESNVQNYYTDSNDILYIPYRHFKRNNDSNAFLAYATHYDTVKALIDDIETIDKNIGVFTITYQAPQLADASKAILTIGPFVINLTLLITAVLLFLIYSQYINNRKIEICLLKANGFSKTDLLLLIISELALQVTIITILAFFICQIVTHSLSLLYGLTTTINVFSIISSILFLSTVMISIPSLISLIMYLYMNPIQILQNNY